MEYLWERVRSFLPRDDLLCLRESQVPRRMRLVRARLDDCAVADGTCTPSAVLGRRNDVFMRVGWNAYHKAVDGNNDDSADAEVHSDSFQGGVDD